jgi:hypothetical protein
MEDTTDVAALPDGQVIFIVENTVRGAWRLEVAGAGGGLDSIVVSGELHGDARPSLATFEDVLRDLKPAEQARWVIRVAYGTSGPSGEWGRVALSTHRRMRAPVARPESR